MSKKKHVAISYLAYKLLKDCIPDKCYEYSITYQAIEVELLKAGYIVNVNNLFEHGYKLSDSYVRSCKDSKYISSSQLHSSH